MRPTVLPTLAEVLIKTRQARPGATRWIAPSGAGHRRGARRGHCTLTNNSSSAASRASPAWTRPTRAPSNVMDKIIRWKETATSTGHARWDHLPLAGDPANARPAPGARGPVTSEATLLPAP